MKVGHLVNCKSQERSQRCSPSSVSNLIGSRSLSDVLGENAQVHELARSKEVAPGLNAEQLDVEDASQIRQRHRSGTHHTSQPGKLLPGEIERLADRAQPAGDSS